MEKSTFEQMGGTYRQEGDYFLPNLAVPESTPVGIWGQRRRRYLREYRKPLYNALLLGGKLGAHLTDVDQQAEDLFSQLVRQIAMQENISEQLKANDQIEWVSAMNNVKNRVIEIVNAEIIYA
ncbi:MAG: TnpV protein [Oscillibacter sp.]|nr:TnpV protein [Oscillibacter sp.]